MRMHLMLTAAQILSHAGMRPTATAATSSASTSSRAATLFVWELVWRRPGARA